MKPRHALSAGLAVLALAALLFAVPAGRRPFWSSDEARFALLAQDILNRGHWLVPELRGQLYLNKPQLYFWSIAVVSLPAGRVTETTAAIPSVVSSVATVAAVIAIGRLLWGWPAGLLAGLILTATPAYFVFSHQVLSDVMMTAWMMWALYFLLRASRQGWPVLPLLAWYFCVGAAVLSKGAAGLAVLAAGVGAVAAITGVAGLRRMRWAWALPALGLVALAWIAPYLVQSEGGFTSKVLFGDYRVRYFQGEFWPRIAQLGRIPLNFLPWTIFLVAAAICWRRQPDPGRRWIGVATLTLAVTLALSGTQRARYLLPVYPGLALLTAEFLVRSAERWRVLLRASFLGLALFALAAAIAAAALAGGVTGEDRAFVPDTPLERGLIGGLLAATALAAALGAWRRQPSAATVAAALLIAAVLLVEGVSYPPRYARDNDVRSVAAAAARQTPPGAIIVAHPDLRLSYDFYLERRVVEAGTPEAVARLLDGRAGNVVITTRERWTSLARGLPPTWRVLTSGTVGDREIVVVGNPPS